MSEPLHAAARRIRNLLSERGFDCTVVEFAETTRTSAEAAEQVGCGVGQIAKSLVFRAKPSGRAVLVVASGANRVSEAKLERLLGEPVRMGPPKFVREVTGYAIGGIPPLGHAQKLDTIVDAHLLALEKLWAAAGHPNSLFPLTPDELVMMTGGRVAEVAA